MDFSYPLPKSRVTRPLVVAILQAIDFPLSMTEQLQKTLRISLLCLLILWGGYTVLTYLSVQVHQAVLLSEASQASITSRCGANLFCQQWNTFFPFIGHTIGRAAPFLWYLVWSVIAYGVLLGMSFMKTGEWKLRFTMTPLKMCLAFLGCTWLLFTVLSFGSIDGQPYSRVFMPSAQVYPGADQSTINTLAEDYMQLKESGCLTEVQSASVGVEISEVHHLCMQRAFVTRVFTEMLSIGYLLFVLLAFGRMLLQLLRVPAKTPLLEAVFSAALGVCGLIVVLWLFAVAGVYTQLAGWLVLGALPFIAWPHAVYWVHSLANRRWEFTGAWHSAFLFLTWLLLSYLVFNFLTVVRPFPIGWDDLGVYLNDPRLLVSYGKFIPRMGAFQWEYITSLGFLLFGYNSWFGATTSMMINWMAGLFAVFAIYAFGATYLGRRQGLIAALLYYTLPLVGHFSFADMKVDNAVFTMGALCILAAFLGVFPAHTEEEHDNDDAEVVPAGFSWQWIILAGILGGFGFAMKPTTVMVVMSVFSVLVGVLLQPAAFIGGGFLAWAVFTFQNVFNVKDVFQRLFGNPDVVSRSTAGVLFAVIGAAIIGVFSALHPARVKKAFLVSAVFLAVFVGTLLPWVIHNNIVAGNVIPKLILRTPNRITPDFLVGGQVVGPEDNARSLPAELAVDPQNAACVGGTSKVEELDRYWGYGTGISHYLGLPWRSVMNTDSAGYYVTTIPALLLFPLLLLLPYFWTKKGRWLRWLFVATSFMVVQWVFLANGVPWYGIGMFLGLVIGLEALVAKAPDQATKITASVFLGLSLLIAFGNRFWQFENQRSLYTYAFGVVSAPAMQERTIPHYNLIRDVVIQRAETMPDAPYVYRVGTFIPYFIPKNLEVLPIADNQLDLFSCINQDKDAQLTLKRMKALGFNSIIFDTNTATIERDPNGTLHKKVEAFLDFANTPGLGLQAVVNDTAGGIVYILLP